MENWFVCFTKKKLFVFGLLIFAITVSISWKNSALNWGFTGHKKINKLAIFTLPPPLFAFYKEHIEYISEHAVDPDKRRYTNTTEAPCHYIDLDSYQMPFDSIPKSWTKAVQKFGEDSLRKHGIVPWHVQLVKMLLQKAFEEKNIDLILKYSSDIGHYIADAHVPLHTTKNYNGQLTNQQGIHGLWESRLIELYSENYHTMVGKASYIDNLQQKIWQAVKTSNDAVDSVLFEEKKLTSEGVCEKYTYEKRGKNIVRTYSKEFCDLYHQKLNGMVEKRFRKSIHSVGSIWYTAWVDAGQPDLSSLLNKKPSKKFKEKFKENEKIQALMGRICDH
jgi:hypothetical protein